MTVTPHNKPSLGEEELNAAQEVITSGMLAGGKQTALFEDEICQFLGLPKGHAVATSTGSSALFLSLTMLKSKKVVIPTYVCHSLKQAAKLAKVETEFVDIAEDSTVICQKSLSSCDADTLIHPYIYGEASELPKFSGHIIEDVAQALGASVNNQKLGTIADIGVLSFYATKLITSGGQGGMVVSKNKQHIKDIRNYLNFDMPTDQLDHFNLPMTEIQAAIGRSQLKKLPNFLKKREEIWQIYHQAGLPLMNINSDTNELNKNLVINSVKYRAILMTPKAKQLINYLAEHNIVAIVPIEEGELLTPTKNALKLTMNTVSLPIYPSLSHQQAEKIARLCQKFFSRKDGE
jgi:perosamine synthetase